MSENKIDKDMLREGDSLDSEKEVKNIEKSDVNNIIEDDPVVTSDVNPAESVISGEEKVTTSGEETSNKSEVPVAEDVTFDKDEINSAEDAASENKLQFEEISSEKAVPASEKKNSNYITGQKSSYSSKSSLDSDKVIREEVLKSRRERNRAAEEKRRKKRRKKRLGILAGIVVMLGLFMIISQSRCNYYRYIEEMKTEENGGVFYEPFARGCIKYSDNGIEYQEKFGKSKWNVGLSMSKPFLAKSDHYVFIADKGGVEIRLFDINGEVMEDKMPYPIVQIDVSDNGTMVAILKGNHCNYLRVMDKSGKVIADTQISLDESGYPLAASISPNGTKLVIAYYSIIDLKSQTILRFYDLTRQIQSGNESFGGKLNFEGNLIPKLKFVSNSKIVAFADNRTYYLTFKDKPDSGKIIDFDYNIESVFSSDDYFGYVCDNDNAEEGQYRVFLYDKNGKKKMEKTIDMTYDKLYLIGDQIVATKDNTCTIINKRGNILFQGELDGGRIENVLPCFGWRTYRIVFGSKVVKMKLSFWDD